MAGNCCGQGRHERRLEKYSVLMSVYKKEQPAYLAESLNSILRQTVPPDQIVLVLDGPLTKELDGVVEQFRMEHQELFLIVRIEKCGGLGPALQKGLSYCRNELVARMDSDDIAVLERCSMQLQVFFEKKVDIVGGIIEEFDGDICNILGKRIPPESPGAIRKGAGRRNPFNHMSVMYRKSVVLAAGGYQDFPYFEDYYLWARMLKAGAVGTNIQKTLIFARTGENMYQRRGGWFYGKQSLKFRWYLKKSGISGWPDFVITAPGQFLVSILPNGFRKKFYEIILRKSN